MKKIKGLKTVLFCLLCFVLVLSFASCSGDETPEEENPNAEAVVTDENGFKYVLTTDKTGYNISGYVGDKTEIEIPESFNGKPVMGIADGAFKGNKTIVSVAGVSKVEKDGDGNVISKTAMPIPAKITSIGASAFEGCDRLTSFYFNPISDMQMIGASAFAGCKKLEQAVVPYTVSSVGASAFAGCESLSSINFSDFYTASGNWVAGENGFLYSGEVGDYEKAVYTITFDVDCTFTYSYRVSTAEGDEFTVYKNGAPTDVSGKWGIQNALVNVSLDVKAGDSLTFEYAKDYIESTGAHDDEVTIKLPVVQSSLMIGDYAFSDCRSLTSVTVKNKINSIGAYVFSGCASLESVTFDGGANGEFQFSAIPNGMFQDCTSLKSISLPDSIQMLGDAAFSGCKSLNNIKMSAAVTNIGNSAFSGCESMVSFDIPVTVSSIGNTAFFGCTSLENIVFAGTDMVIGEFAFANCSALEKLELSGEVKSIGASAFEKCVSLTAVSFKDDATVKIETIGASAFKNCALLTEAEIPAGVKEIGASAFAGCKKLEKIEFAASYENGIVISESSFAGCASLEAVTVPAGTTAIGASAFAECKKLSEIIYANDGKLAEIGDFAFKNCASLKTVSIPEGVETLGERAFFNCKSAESLYIPKSLEEIGNEAFKLCSALGAINVAADNNAYAGVDNCLVNTAEKKIILGCKNSVIPADGTVEIIGAEAFYACSELARIVIPANITAIEDKAFEECYKLVEVVNLSALNAVKGEEANGMVAYYADWVLTTLDVRTNVVYVGDFVFLTNESGNYLVSYNGTEDDVVLPDSFNGEKYEIYSYAFYRNNTIKSVEIPAAVTAIGYYAFNDCKNLDKVYISDLEAWCKIDFDGVYSNPLYYAGELMLNNRVLDGFSIPAGITEIKPYSFCGGSFITVMFGSEVTEIGAEAFRDCINLVYIEINNITSIGDRAFYGCEKLVDVRDVSVLEIEKGSEANGYVGYYALSVKNNTVDAPLVDITADGFIFYANGSEVYLLGYMGTEENVVLPADYNGSAYEIYKCAFYGKDIKSVTISSGVTAIGSYAFAFCEKLEKAVIPASVAEIGRDAFFSAPELKISAAAAEMPEGWDIYFASEFCPITWSK